ncbi:MAG: hypothetical protein P9M12_01955 [Candidatus Aceula lacicola]|nr:hypothetical protein [Candidatus Aceula lacicola]
MKSKKEAQSAIEYILLVTALIAFLLVFLAPSGGFHNMISDGVTNSVHMIQDMTDGTNFATGDYTSGGGGGGGGGDPCFGIACSDFSNDKPNCLAIHDTQPGIPGARCCNWKENWSCSGSWQVSCTRSIECVDITPGMAGCDSNGICTSCSGGDCCSCFNAECPSWDINTGESSCNNCDDFYDPGCTGTYCCLYEGGEFGQGCFEKCTYAY